MRPSRRAAVMGVVSSVFAVAGLGAAAQAPPQPSFEVVCIRPTQPGSSGGPGPFVSTTPGRLQARGPLLFFIEYAYGIRGAQIEGGPAWIRSDRFDLNAALAPGIAMVPAPAALQAVLVDRFALQVHRVTREVDILTLVIANGGHRMTASRPGDEAGTQGAPGRLVATRMTMRQLASQLARMAGMPLEDRTRLDGEFNVTLTWAVDDQRPDPLGRPAAGPDAPALSTALQEQLGLRLERARGQVEFVIVDRAERPTPD